MMKILTKNQAQNSILKRGLSNRSHYSPVTLERTETYFGKGVTPAQAVERILRSVETEGDLAVGKWSALLDSFDGRVAVSSADIKKAFLQLDPEIRSALEEAARRIRAFHQKQPVQSWTTDEMGGVLGQRVTPIESVGVYVPGGTAPLPSSLLMSVIPARVAGVTYVYVATPPAAHPSILAAAYLCGVDAVYQVGGAQAIAAMAFGTESIPKVDKVVGAGNLFVTLAKQQLFGVVGLDGLAGPTETMVIADESANPAWVAADLLAQAEHDVQASAILLTPDRGLAEAVRQQVLMQLEELSRREVIKSSLENAGGIILTDDLEQAIALANQYGAEHLCLSVSDPEAWLPKIHNAGGIFLGDHSFEVLGDYAAGPSHIMPTGGTARFASPLSVLDFVKITSVIGLEPQTARELCQIASKLAATEGLTAHAAAARARMEAL
jgi:histidinol dehydrogenase